MKDKNNKLQFYSFFEKYINGATRRISNILKKYKLENEEKILLDLERQIYQVIYSISVRTLIYELNIWKNQYFDELNKYTHNEVYLLYCKNFLNKTFTKNFEKKYPVLIDKIQKKINYTVEFIDLFFTHLFKDEEQLKDKFGFKANALIYIDISAGGDVHNHGQQTIILSDGVCKILYKPHDLETDIFFGKLVNMLNENLEKELRVPKTINQNTYGWQEFVEEFKRDNDNDNKEYYYRYGEMLCLSYSLKMTDLHNENVIQNGIYPIIIDTETMIFNSSYANNIPVMQNAYGLMNQMITDSVLNTMLLPLNILGGFYDFDLSPLSIYEEQNSEQLSGYIVVDEFSDQIHFERQYYKSETKKGINPCLYLKELLDGFTKCYILIIKNKKRIKKFIIDYFKNNNIKIRQVLKPTYSYYKFYDASNHPDYLHSVQEQNNLFGILKPKNVSPNNKFLKKAYKEIESLLNGDIPYFYEIVDSKKLCSVYGNVNDFYEENILEIILKRIEKIDYDDLITQQRMIKLSMATLGKSNWNYGNLKINKDIKDYNYYFVNKEDYVENICDYVCSEAVFSQDKNLCTWAAHAVGMEKLKIYPINSFLYDGGGIIVLLASEYVETQNELYKLTVKAALRGFESLEMSKVLSAYNGIGSLLYIYYYLYELWNESIYYTKFQNMLNEIAHIEINSNINIDFCNGLAGMVVLLVNIYKKDKNIIIKNLLKKYSEYIIENIDNINLAGLAHGYAGVSLAIAGCYNIFKEKKYLKIVEELIIRENKMFDNKIENWKDVRDKNNIGDSLYWCHGASGIAISRMRVYEYTNLPICKSDIQRAVKKINQDFYKVSNHSLCHGKMGNIEVLDLISNNIFEYKNMKKEINDKFTNTINDIFDEGVVCGISNAYDMLSFMLGITGMAYSILRYKTKKYPSLLLLDI